MASTSPVSTLLPLVGWRGVFFVLAGTTVLTASAIALLAPATAVSGNRSGWRDNLAGLREIYRHKGFWRFAPLSASVIGTAFAVQGLWAARWLADVDRFGSKQVISDLLAINIGLTLGAPVIGLTTAWLRRHGVRPLAIFGCACALFMALQCAVISRLAAPAWLLWGMIGSFGAMTALSYSITGEMSRPTGSAAPTARSTCSTSPRPLCCNPPWDCLPANGPPTRPGTCQWPPIAPPSSCRWRSRR
jgi:predicted MFS family arabinose efflux permease